MAVFTKGGDMQIAFVQLRNTRQLPWFLEDVQALLRNELFDQLIILSWILFELQHNVDNNVLLNKPNVFCFSICQIHVISCNNDNATEKIEPIRGEEKYAADDDVGAEFSGGGGGGVNIDGNSDKDSDGKEEVVGNIDGISDEDTVGKEDVVGDTDGVIDGASEGCQVGDELIYQSITNTKGYNWDNTRSTPQEIDSIQHTLEGPSEKHLVMQMVYQKVYLLDCYWEKTMVAKILKALS